MIDENNMDWVENYGFILVAFAHMTDWRLSDTQLKIINEKLQLMLSQTDKEFNDEDVAQKLVKILHRYHDLKEGEGKKNDE